MTAAHRSRRILILGGSGFVGRRLAQLLAGQGYTVRVPTRNRARARALLVLPEVELIAADVHDDAVLARLARGCDVAVNLIGILNERGRDGSGFEHAHVALAAKLVRACRDSGIARLLHMSALKADAERGPSHYLRSKGRAEKIVADASAVTATIFRPSVIFGPEDSFINRFATLLRRLPVLPLARAEARLAPVFVDDVAQAFAVALADAQTGNKTYELCGPDIYSLEEIVRFVRAQLQLRRAVLPLPDTLGKLQAAFADYLLPGKPFSLDNFASLTVASVCNSNGLAALGIERHSLSAVVPTYLRYRGPLARFRQDAGRRG